MFTAMKKKSEQNLIGMWNSVYFDVDHGQPCRAQNVEVALKTIAPFQSLL